MSVFKRFETVIRAAVEELNLAGVEHNLAKVGVEPPRDPTHGDLATNAAMVLAKPAGLAPRALAERLIEKLRTAPGVTGAEIAGPGFINLRLEPAVWLDELRTAITDGARYGAGEPGQGVVNVEYVSANPTGPLHAGHARGAVVGDALANLLAFAGWEVTREYYVNDAGAQVDVLARSAYLRYREALGQKIGDIPSGLYPGEYLKEVGEALAAEHGPALVGLDEAEWLPTVRAFAVAAMLEEIQADLALMGIHMDVFSSERALVEAGAVDQALAALDAAGQLYTGVLEPPKGKLPDDWEPRPQLLFRAAAFGDDTDRPLKKSDGSFTYFASDIAYHYDKLRRTGPNLIDVMGADHGGYVKRMQAAVKALSGGAASVDIKLCAIVKLMEHGEPVKMSKRAGTFVTLRDVVERVGADVVRFIMLTRRNDQTLEFDYAKVTETSKENPVFYVQYAHARCRSVQRHAAELFAGADLSPAALAKLDLAPLADPDEVALAAKVAAWPRTVEQAAESHEPHRVAFYLGELAAQFHSLWTRARDDAEMRMLLPHDRPKSFARLALVEAVRVTIAAGLGVLGVTPVEELRA